MPPRDIFAQLSLWIVNFHLKSYIFCHHFILYFAWVDPDPHFKYGSGSGFRSTTLSSIAFVEVTSVFLSIFYMVFSIFYFLFWWGGGWDCISPFNVRCHLLVCGFQIYFLSLRCIGGGLYKPLIIVIIQYALHLSLFQGIPAQEHFCSPVKCYW